MHHDDIIDIAVKVVKNTSLRQVTDAFVGSLSTRNMPARSALSSLAVLQHIQHHEFQPSSKFHGSSCYYCGLKIEGNQLDALYNIANYPYQSHHDNIDYSTYDLITFDDRVVDKPIPKDSVILNEIINGIQALEDTAQLSDLNKAIQGKLKSNKHERTKIIELFGFLGVLLPKNQKSYKDEYLTYEFVNSVMPSNFYKRDWKYPVRFWQGSDGVNMYNFNYYFSDYV